MTHTVAALKEKLQQIAAADYAIPAGGIPDDLLESMLMYIGSVDSELRDDLIYGTLATWISDNGLSHKQMKRMLITLLDQQHLFSRIGEVDTDSVFTRSFSALTVQLILSAHRRSSFLDHQKVHYVKDCLFRYGRQEKDRRGFVEARGWAHSAAHSADTLGELAQCNELDADDLKALLDEIRFLIVDAETVYIYEEDERLSEVAVAIIGRQALPISYWQEWIGSFSTHLESYARSFPEDYYGELNAKNFWRSLYFRIQHNRGEMEIEQDFISQLLDLILNVGKGRF